MQIRGGGSKPPALKWKGSKKCIWNKVCATLGF